MQASIHPHCMQCTYHIISNNRNNSIWYSMIFVQLVLVVLFVAIESNSNPGRQNKTFQGRRLSPSRGFLLARLLLKVVATRNHVTMGTFWGLWELLQTVPIEVVFSPRGPVMHIRKPKSKQSALHHAASWKDEETCTVFRKFDKHQAHRFLPYYPEDLRHPPKYLISPDPNSCSQVIGPRIPTDLHCEALNVFKRQTWEHFRGHGVLSGCRVFVTQNWPPTPSRANPSHPSRLLPESMRAPALRYRFLPVQLMLSGASRVFCRIATQSRTLAWPHPNHHPTRYYWYTHFPLILFIIFSLSFSLHGPWSHRVSFHSRAPNARSRLPALSRPNQRHVQSPSKSLETFQQWKFGMMPFTVHCCSWF